MNTDCVADSPVVALPDVRDAVRDSCSVLDESAAVLTATVRCLVLHAIAGLSRG